MVAYFSIDKVSNIHYNIIPYLKSHVVVDFIINIIMNIIFEFCSNKAIHYIRYSMHRIPFNLAVY